MAQFVLVLLILAHTFLALPAASSRIGPSVVDQPAFSPAVQTAEAPRSGKLGKHHASESEPPTAGSSSDHEGENGMYLEKQHHHGSRSVDKSIAGGGVILGGLVMAFVVSIVCYIRATRRRSTLEPSTPTTVSSV